MLLGAAADRERSCFPNKCLVFFGYKVFAGLASRGLYRKWPAQLFFSETFIGSILYRLPNVFPPRMIASCGFVDAVGRTGFDARVAATEPPTK